MRQRVAEQRAEIDGLRAERKQIWDLLPNPERLKTLAAELDTDYTTRDGPTCRVWAQNLEEICVLLDDITSASPGEAEEGKHERT